MHAETESVDINLDGRDAAPLPGAQGVASEVYRAYMRKRRRGDTGKGPSPEGLPLSGRHPAARALAIEPLWPAAPTLSGSRSRATRSAWICVNRP
jgi:hypothetical protein